MTAAEVNKAFKGLDDAGLAVMFHEALGRLGEHSTAEAIGMMSEPWAAKLTAAVALHVGAAISINDPKSEAPALMGFIAAYPHIIKVLVMVSFFGGVYFGERQAEISDLEGMSR